MAGLASLRGQTYQHLLFILIMLILAFDFTHLSNQIIKVITIIHRKLACSSPGLAKQLLIKDNNIVDIKYYSNNIRITIYLYTKFVFTSTENLLG